MGAVIVVGLVILFVGVRRASRRFEEQQRALGRWDENGPLVETEGPPRGMRGNLMGWRLEVIGRWNARIVRRREPHEK